ncbi:MAG TPA: glycosyltransferase [Stellaceae bacterium]|nr:glycosyltransferase [Stellaceae bacterium]
MAARIAVVTPVFNDWECFAALVAELSERFAGSGTSFDVIALDDGSIEPFDEGALVLRPGGAVASVEVLPLATNLGHQRAIAIGLCAAVELDEAESVLVMDCDGEDRPSDIERLLEASRENPARIVFAKRARRSEGLAFRACYALYKGLFRLLTGRAISFGNFALIPMAAARRLVHTADLWNNVAAAILRSRVPYVAVPTERGHRYAGNSSMNPIALIMHGLSAMSVYSDLIFVRVLVTAGAVAALSVAGIAVVAAIRFATDLAIPGWASMIVGDLAIILMQTTVLMIATSLMMLTLRSSRPMVPLVDSRAYLGERRTRLYAPAKLEVVPARALP